jgi:aminopeptidase-like protein
VRRLIEDLYPICRSITGPGVRATLDRIAVELPITRRSLPTGTPVFDWAVPEEWTLRAARLTRLADGEAVVDAAVHNLHVVNSSTAVDAVLSLDELRPHLHSLPDRPDAIPYRTSYYHRTWGFCLTDRQLRSLDEGPYHAFIDAEHTNGVLDWAEIEIEGDTDDVVLFTTHTCHPSLANDNLSGIAVLVALAKHLRALPSRRFTYHLAFIPGTIGSLTWLSAHPELVPRIRHGLVVTGLGDGSPFTYKLSRRGDRVIDRLAARVVEARGGSTMPFEPYGYDERQFCSPGFDLPVGRLTRGVHGRYPEYHTSMDDLDFVSDQHLEASLEAVIALVHELEHHRTYRSTSPFGEPQLGRRGLYRTTGGSIDSRSVEMGYLWVLNLADGDADLQEIAHRSGLPLEAIEEAARRLVAADLLVEEP